jgi:hypothetical protein
VVLSNFGAHIVNKIRHKGDEAKEVWKPQLTMI